MLIGRTRKVRPTIWTDDLIAGDGAVNVYVFMGILVFSSKWGKIVDDAAEIKSAISPYRNDLDVQGAIDFLCSTGVLKRHEENGVRYLQVQNIQRYCEIKPDAKDHGAEARRRARKRMAMPAWADLNAIRAIYRDAKKRIKETGMAWHVDHIIPLAGKNVCGLHVHWNLQVIPAEDNLKKSNKF